LVIGCLERSPYPGIVRRSGGLTSYANPIVLVGVGLSLVLSVLLDVTGAASGVESLLAGLAGTTVTLLLDATARAERRFRLRTAVEATDWLPGVVESLGDAVAAINARHTAPEIEQETRRRFDQLRADLEELARGRIVGPFADHRTLLEPTEACRERLDAVTNALAAGAGAVRWWRSEVGQRYWAANLAALARGVTVTRTFICDGVDDELAALVEAQRAAGVDVLVLPADAVPRTRHVNIAVWDRRCGWTADMNARGEIVGDMFTVDGRDVARLLEVVEACRRAAR
jgi:hypothetical protein